MGPGAPPSTASQLLWCHLTAAPVPPSLLLVASPCCPLHGATAEEAFGGWRKQLDEALTAPVWCGDVGVLCLDMKNILLKIQNVDFDK